jgi:hypothetical protein
MSFDSTPQLPDISTPTLANLVWVLRHREVWPAKFEWDYADCETCAMGLAARLWRQVYRPNSETMARVFRLSQLAASKQFTQAYSVRTERTGWRTLSKISPEDIADNIEWSIAQGLIKVQTEAQAEAPV